MSERRQSDRRRRRHVITTAVVLALIALGLYAAFILTQVLR